MLLGKELDSKVQSYIRALFSAGHKQHSQSRNGRESLHLPFQTEDRFEPYGTNLQLSYLSHVHIAKIKLAIYLKVIKRKH